MTCGAVEVLRCSIIFYFLFQFGDAGTYCVVGDAADGVDSMATDTIEIFRPHVFIARWVLAAKACCSSCRKRRTILHVSAGIDSR
jgi:hypothetical protein